MTIKARNRPQVMMTLSPGVLTLLDSLAAVDGWPRSRMVEELVKAEVKRRAKASK